MLLSYSILGGRLALHEQDCQTVEDANYLCLYYGTLRASTELAIQAVAGSVESEGCSDCFLGPYLTVTYHKRNRAISIRQHYFGAPVTLYYAHIGNNFFLSTSLVQLRSHIRTDIALNVDMLPHFFYNGFLPGTHTLAKGIHKLPPGWWAELDADGIQIGRTSYRLETDLQVPDEEFYTSAMRESVKALAQAGDNPCDIALSGGYDSNCILHFLHGLFPHNAIRAFSVGGIIGTDETATARSIASFYPAVAFFSSLVTPETRLAMDDIVYRLEGSVYERGIFLQYELAKLLRQHGSHRLICGECADQVFHSKGYSPAGEKTFLFDYRHTPYEMASNVVLKKSSLMLNSFGIAGAYPFLDMNVLRLGYRTRERNGTNKRFHREQCIRLLPEEITILLAKTGGSTSLCALFDSSFDGLQAAKQMRYYSDSFHLSQKYEKREAALDYYLSLCYLESFERQFCGSFN